MSSIGLLHITDFHQGMDSQTWRWPNVKENFLDDLERLHGLAGPWEAIVFTGDLTQRGLESEFRALDLELESILTRLGSLGSRPVVFPVPGNHDLRRPKRPSKALATLSEWHVNEATRDAFFCNRRSATRKVVDAAFMEYVRWWNARTKASALQILPGELPGDFGATLEKDGLRLAVVGLNSAFLQLRDRMREGDLDVDPRQLFALTENVPEWLRNHHAALLMTHHPVSWLHQKSRRRFREEIDLPRRFAAHLFGHMHSPLATSRSRGGVHPRLALQGMSLFGLDTYQLPTGNNIKRRHGYAAMRISVRDSTGALTLWPRSYEMLRGDYRRMIPDHKRYELENEATTWRFQALRPFTIPSAPVAPPSTQAPVSAATPQGPQLGVALKAFAVEGTMWMGGNADVEDGRFSAELVVRLLAPSGGVHITSINLSCVNRNGVWAWSQDQRAFVNNEGGRSPVGIVSYSNLTRAQEVDRAGCLLSIEREFKPRLPMQYPYEWDTKGTCFVLDVRWTTGNGPERAQRFCFVWQAARAIALVEAPPSPPILGRAELLRLEEQGFLERHERDLLESVDDEERYLLKCHPEHYRGRYRATGPAYDILLSVLDELFKRLEGHPFPPFAPRGRSHRVEFTVAAQHKEVTLPMNPSRPETLRVTSHGIELSVTLDGLIVRLAEAFSFDISIVVTWIE